MSTPRRQLSTLQRYTVLGLLSLTLGTIYALVLRHAHSTAASGGESSEISVAADSPASFNTVAPFTLTDSSGKPFTLAALLGKPWIVDFVFTRCTGPCPVVTSSMRRAQDLLAGDAVHLVTITVDPEYDTPEVLAEYAHGIGADLSRWTFLTGDSETVHRIVRGSLQFLLQPDTTRTIQTADGRQMNNITHPTKLLLIGPDRQVLGMYEPQSEDDLKRLEAKARAAAARLN